MISPGPIQDFFDGFILDCAREGVDLAAFREHHTLPVSLYQGMSQDILYDVAPYLMRCSGRARFTAWLFEQGWGKSWGIFFSSGAPIQELRKHFRKLLLVRTEGGQELYFRFYDPRVLRIFLPTCTAAQLSVFFGPVQKYIVEDEDPCRALVFSLEDGSLKMEILDLCKEATPTAKAEVRIPKIPSVRRDENTIV